MDEVKPSIAEVNLKACVVAIYVTELVIGHLSIIILPQSLIPSPQ
ncbi:hypothetical protein [Nostoc sp. FACHB-892]|nr:hypothetical protein [Nostoc sp. FACHB-892]